MKDCKGECVKSPDRAWWFYNLTGPDNTCYVDYSLPGEPLPSPRKLRYQAQIPFPGLILFRGGGV